MPILRLDRTLTLNFFHPLARLGRGHRNGHIPILMYHGIEPPTRKGHAYYETSTSPETFARQMKYLHDHGYTAVDLEAGLQTMFTGRGDKKYVIITFDDGYRNFYTGAYPILAEHGFQATVFLISGLVSDNRVNHNGHEYLTWCEVRELHSNGIRIGSHTVTHPELRTIKAEAVEFELGYSKQTIEDRLGDPVRAFSFPFAFPEQDQRFTEWLRGHLEAQGYVCGVSTILGTANANDDWFFLPRLPINSHDDLSLLRAKLEGGYDWLHFPQRLYKSFLVPESSPAQRGLRQA